ncbi:hypothetical protein E4U59_001014 [Claviceps monticola]|nr:hypothetical protein E4U59_001014 [Claviceps monticola]
MSPGQKSGKATADNVAKANSSNAAKGNTNNVVKTNGEIEKVGVLTRGNLSPVHISHSPNIFSSPWY